MRKIWFLFGILILISLPLFGAVEGQGSRYLSDLSDVSLTSPSEGEILVYDGSNWVNNSDVVVKDGKVGIQTDSPVTPLHIEKENNGGRAVALEVVNPFATDKTSSAIAFVASSERNNRWGIIELGRDESTTSSWMAFSVYRGAGEAPSDYEVMRLTSSGRVGIKNASPSYDLDVSGDIHCTGKLTSDGGNDPPYVLYDYQTRETIIEMIKREIPPSKLNGAVLFFNGEAGSLELFLPSKGEFRSLDGGLLQKVEPITKTFEVEKRYYFDEETGEVKSYEVKKRAKRYKLKPGVFVDPLTGKFKKRIKVEKVIDGEKGEKVEEEEVVEISKDEAVEEVLRKGKQSGGEVK